MYRHRMMSNSRVAIRKQCGVHYICGFQENTGRCGECTSKQARKIQMLHYLGLKTEWHYCIAQADMYQKALEEYNSCKEVAHTWEEFMAALNRRHMVLAPW